MIFFNGLVFEKIIHLGSPAKENEKNSVRNGRIYEISKI